MNYEEKTTINSVRGLENNPKIETRKDGTNQWKKSN